MTDKNSKKTTYTALALLCFSLADIHDGLGPFLGVYLQQQQWTAKDIGYVMTAGSLIGLACTAPFGAFVDYTPKKKHYCRFRSEHCTELRRCISVEFFFCRNHSQNSAGSGGLGHTPCSDRNNFRACRTKRPCRTAWPQ